MDEDNKNTYIVIIILGVLIVGLFFYFFITKTSFGTHKIFREIDAKHSFVIFYTNSNTKKCDNCASIKEELDSLGISYKLYDVGSETIGDTKSLHDKLNIDFDVSYPAVILVQKGKMYANIVDIKERDSLTKFIKANNVEKDGTIKK